MGLLSFFKKETKTAHPHMRGRVKTAAARNFAAGEIDRLTASFTGSYLSINQELRRSLVLMRKRSRELCANNDYARKFLKLVKANVIGPQGIKLQAQFLNDRGEMDLSDIEFVESKWRNWAKPDKASACRTLSWLDIQNLVVETLARDGEVLIQKIKKPRTDSVFRLRVLECDHLDVTHNETLKNGRRIEMGVEVNEDGERLAYWISDRHPGDTGQYGDIRRRRIPADQIIHLFIPERAGQLRGVPWMHSAILRLNMLGKYEEAELVAARVGASKMGFFTSADGDEFGADDAASTGREYDDHDLISQAEPGTFHQLPEGVNFSSFDPQHPTAAFPDFTKAVLRGASSGLNVSYNTLANDLEGVNFSSIRSGVLEEREHWRMLQGFLVEHLHDPIYHEWLEEENISGQLTALPPSRLDTKFKAIKWQPRGWSWVDPLKDVKASADEFSLGTISLTEICAAKGKDFGDVLKQTRADLDLAKSYGLTVGVVNGQLEIKEPEQNES